jgi:hypothetical protein
MPPPNVKPVAQVAEKWARRVAGASEDYTRGASAAGARWQAGATGAESNYKTATAEAAAKGRYGKGVQKAGAEKFTRGVTDKGSVRYGPGASAAQPDFAKAIGPVLDVIARTDLPPRGPRGAESNYMRSMAVGKALRQFANTQ